MKNLLFLIWGIQFLFSTISINANPSSGIYLSSKMKTEHGFLILGLDLISNQKESSFLAQELRYHSERGWEEVLFSGRAEKKEEIWNLFPKSCQVRSSLLFETKKGLLRRFDCEHLSFQIHGKGENRNLSSSLFGTFTNVPLPYFLEGVSGEPIGISFPLPSGEEGIWGFHLNGLGNKNPIQIWDHKKQNWAIWSRFMAPEPDFDYSIYRWRRTFSN
ncbi:hypothetical protein [Leptospira idonii]|uniref:Uncharacterized protein n=1 Tax=Leptospira idonii TaxID=1193500 RepID=A0A4R9M2U9_9LEPT|nr:hypothetical protein [Leptospira idonii]TGN19619.1 hypothetical protein EHS15_07480 [Leptospira idonii]